MIGLRELVVHNMRGVRDLRITAKEKSIVLVGPNGSGKSSVVDALDFLLTGRVHRLEGEGAGGLSLADHGKHVDAELADAWVEATFMVGAPQKKPFTIKRSVKPAKLEPASIPAPLLELIEQAGRYGHHVLSRREILKFILATPGSRRDQVAALLDIEEIDQQRKELAGAAKDAQGAAKHAREAVDARTRELLSIFQPSARDLDDVLAKVNSHRVSLGAPTIDELRSNLVRSGVAAAEKGGDVHPLRAIEPRLRALTADYTSVSRVRLDIETYLTAVEAARATDARLADHERQLLEAGIALLDRDRCPLCEGAIAMDTLRAQWHVRLADAARATQEIERLRVERQRLTGLLTELAREIRAIAHELRGVPEGELMAELAVAWSELKPIPDPVKNAESFDLGALDDMTTRVATSAATLLEIAAKLPPPSAGTSARTELEEVERKLRDLEAARGAVPLASGAAEFLGAIDKAFLAARDSVLDGIYSDMAARVQALYGAIHKSTGQPRNTSIKSTKTGLEIEVEFYGRGAYPPAALHSEGQQDTLGICLFLALAERAAGGTPRLLILDDVLMSVDAGHRRAVAELLKAEFSESQLVITTHDEVWAKQLRSLGVVSERLSFESWSIDGTNVALAFDSAFDRIRADLGAERVPTAAHTLRRTLETILPEICEALGASVRFRQDGKNDLGDYYGAVKSRYPDLLKESIKATKSWKQDSSTLEVLLEQFEKGRDAVGREEWTLNPVVHYNEWAQMTVADFAPVVEAYEAFLGFFSCQVCKSLLRWVDRSEVRCGCGAHTWNLNRNKAT